jgi:hypothetical protein
MKVAYRYFVRFNHDGLIDPLRLFTQAPRNNLYLFRSSDADMFSRVFAWIADRIDSIWD